MKTTTAQFSPSETSRWFGVWLLVVLLLCGLVLRLALIPARGYWIDVESFAAWGNSVKVHGLTEVYNTPIAPSLFSPNYPPFLYYILGFIAPFVSVFEAATIKIIAIFFDLLAALVLWFFLRRWPLVQGSATLALVLNPAVYLISSYWGQVDSIAALLVFAALALATTKRYRAAACLLALAVTTKIQAALFVPLLSALCVFDRRRVVPPLLAGAGTLVAIAAPFLFTGHAAALLHPFFGVLRSYPYLTVNAMNMWWPVAGGELVSDEMRILGIPALYIGMALVVVAVTYTIRFLKTAREPAHVFFAAAFVSLALFFFATDMHERYLFPVFILLPVTFVRYRIGWLLYGMLSASFVTNIWYVLAGNPDISNGVLRLGLFHLPWLVNGAALIMMLVTMYHQIRRSSVVTSSNLK